jgi:hypothetical protein
VAPGKAGCGVDDFFDQAAHVKELRLRIPVAALRNPPHVLRQNSVRCTKYVKIISDHSNHPSEEAAPRDVEIVGKVLCCLKLF